MIHELLYVTNARIPTEKAHGLQIIKTVEALMKEGVRVTLVVPKRKNPITADVAEFYGVRGLDIQYLSDPVHFVENIAQETYFFLRRLTFGIQAIYFVFRSRIACVYTRDLLLAFLLQVLTRKIVVYEDHEPKKSLLWFYMWLIRHIDRKVVVARGLESLYTTYGVDPRSYTWIPNGVDLSEINSVHRAREIWTKYFGISPESKIALYVGNLYLWKGVKTLIDAVSELRSEIAVVLIGGTEADSEALAGEAESHGLANIYFHDFLPHAEVIPFMRSADVLVLPNTAKETRSELYTTPIKLFEYMATGVPIVASNLPSIAWYLDRDSACLVEPDDPKLLARGIEQVMDDRAYAERIAQTAAQRVSLYTWQERARKIRLLF